MVVRKPELVEIDNPGFFIANLVKDCPPAMVIRELLQNAIEASGADGRIEYFAYDWNGHKKLGLYNEGVGMTRLELIKRMSMASSGKPLGFDKNFGQGAKMSAAKASPYGLLYRSCAVDPTCDERLVHEILLRLEDDGAGGKVLVKIPRWDEYNQDYEICAQVTDDAERRGRRLDCDWTEAILLGRTEEDDTLKADFLDLGGQKKWTANWLAKYINTRYYTFPPDVVVHNVCVTLPVATRRNAKGLLDSIQGEAYTQRAESVHATHAVFGPVTITYGRLTGTSNQRNPLSGPWFAYGLHEPSCVLLVFRNEIYDRQPKWFNRAGAYGMQGVSEDYYVHIVLANDAPVVNNSHRTSLLRNDGSSTDVQCEDFASLVRAHVPWWVKEEIKSRQEVKSSGSFDEQLRRIAQRLNTYVQRPEVEEDGRDDGRQRLGPGVNGPRGQAGPPRSGFPDPMGDGSRPRRGKPTLRPHPDTLRVLWKDEENDAQWYEDNKGKAGTYDESVHTLYLSRKFRTYVRLTEWAKQQWSDPDQSDLALITLDEQYRVHAAAFAMGALVFRDDASWSPREWAKSLTPEAISCHMIDPLEECQTEVKKRVNQGTSDRIRRHEPAEMTYGS